MKYLLLLLILLSTTPAWSQNNSLHLSLGGALPIGKFASKDVNDPASGLANPGGLAELGYSHLLKDNHWGLTIGIRGRLNGIDKNANSSALRKIYPLYTWSSSNSSWKALSAMAGVYYILPAASKLDVRMELSLGTANCYLPEYTVLGILDTAHTGATSFVQAKVNKEHAVSFSATAKAGIVYHLNKQLNLLANLDFWYLDPNFKHVTQTVIVANDLVIPGVISPANAGSPPSITSETRDYKQNMSTLNLTVGVGISL
ncbi:hypothetical protein Q4E93_15100 [Flavitalea sp. BT771]|uniref:hypothetical protein n=1 Tax=Flavitalea sp. BT771 TaxID=3063329 RepID=UPI0026E163A9|nr:hypothetical protein [Flavitalea sp. BT771]MDO6431932.1 hypothetical protein [Flavitalea sp. BT771]MDV6220841.1 hypothetical protein [Flavitalea sp. BT771]